MGELLIAVLIAFLSAAAGGWLGYILARVRDDRLRTVDLAMKLLSEDFSSKRIQFIYNLSKMTDAELEEAVNPKVAEYEDFRRDSIEIFNIYELICLLRYNGDLNKEIFSTHILPLISEDYAASDKYFQKIEDNQIATGGDLRRPFYDKIAIYAPRGKK